MPLEKSPKTIEEAKIWLRKYLTQKRQSISRHNQLKWSGVINRKVLDSHYFKRAKTIALYLGFGSEVLTDDILKAGWKARKNMLIPITALGLRRPYFAFFKPGDRLRKTPLGPLELIEKKEPYSFRQIDLVVVPGLGFDSRGYRIGYGGGFYDQVLHQAKKGRRLGLFFSNQRLIHIPHQAHDISLQSIITESGIY